MNEKNLYEEIKKQSALLQSVRDELTRLALQVKSLKNELKGVKNGG